MVRARGMVVYELGEVGVGSPCLLGTESQGRLESSGDGWW